MKLRKILPVALLLLPAVASARPAYPGVLKATNPDGTEIEIRRFGDENFSYVTDKEGLRLLECDEKGFWTPMIRDGETLLNTEGTINRLREQGNTDRARYAASNRQFAASLTDDGRTSFPTHAENVHSLVVLLNFSDTKFTTPNAVQVFSDMLNKPGFNEYNAQGSVRDYFEKVSDGQFTPIFDVYPEIVELPRSSAYYNGSGSNSSLPYGQTEHRYTNWHEAIIYAVKTIDVDFSQYDFDEDGIVDTIYFFYAGYGMADTSLKTVVWPHQSDFKYYMKEEENTFDGKKLGPYACSNELNGGVHHQLKDGIIDGIGAFCHEFSHVLGLPDLYDTTGLNTNTPDTWSIMDAGTYNEDSTLPPLYSAYEKWVCKWLEYEVPENGKTYEMQSMHKESRGIRIPIYHVNGKELPNEYYVIECRSNEGYDAGLNDEGLLFWHINYTSTVWASNQVNSNKTKPGVTLFTPGGTIRYANWPGYVTPKTFLSPQKNWSPKLTTYSTVAVDPQDFITGIAYDYDTHIGKFEFNVIESAPEVTCVLHDNPQLNEKGTGVTITWDPVEEADGYYVTVKRTSSSGSENYVGGYNEKFVAATINKATFNISASMKEDLFSAYVRPSVKVPSEKTSNIISFYINDISGVESIDSDNAEMNVFGGKGFIEAPENAEIYTLSGVRAGRENLAPGVYIVRMAGKTVKVFVK